MSEPADPSPSRSADRPGAYFDSASSEPLHPAASAVLQAAMERGYADPRRLHRSAREARILLDNARAAVAEVLGVRPDEVSFTGSGAEAVHRGLLGLAKARERHGRRIVHSAVEHASVAHAATWWGSPVEVGADRLGRVDPDELAGAAAGAEVAVCALQSANHEVATRQPVAALDLPGGVPLMVDARASMGREALPQGDWSALAGSAHHWGGPAGVGVLVVRRGARWLSAFPPDDRIDERTVGFENVPAALAAAAALQAVAAERDEVNARHHTLVEVIRRCAAALPDTEVVGDPVDRLPHLVTFSCLYVAGDALVAALDRHGFAVASGSACTASSLEPSRVLAAMGALTHGNVRVSMARDTTAAQVDHFCAVLPSVLEELRR